MGLPKVTIVQKNGGLRRQAANTDGVAALVISAVRAADGLALDTTAIVNSMDDVEALGITAAFDQETEEGGDYQRVWARIRDFYLEAGAGAKLYIRLVSGSATQTTMLGATGAVYQVLKDAAGDVKLVAVARGNATGTVTNGLDGDVYTAITAAKALVASEQAQYRYVSILIEGRQWSGNTGTVTDLRASDGPNANRVSVILGADLQERDVAANSPFAAANSAAVGLALGRLAAVQVHRNLGRVLDDEVPGVVLAGFSGGQALSAYTDTQLGTLSDKGYLFLRRHSEIAGAYWNEDWTAAPTTDDYGRISRGRTMDKASRITRSVYVKKLLDNVDVDEDTGQIATATLKSYQADVETAIEQQMMTKGEVKAVYVTVDPDQNVLSTDEIDTEVELVPKGLSAIIKATLAYKNPFVTA